MAPFKIILSLFAGLMVSCATGVHRDPFYLNTSRNLELLDGLKLGGEKCEPVLEKKIVYGLFVLPMNQFSEGEILLVRQRFGSVRYREVAYGSDIGLSVLGFLLSIIVKTGIVEGCGPVQPADSFSSPGFKQYQLLELEKKRGPELGEYALQIQEGPGEPAGGKELTMGNQNYRMSHRVLLRDVRVIEGEMTGSVDGFIEKADEDALFMDRPQSGLVRIPRLTVLKILIFIKPL